MGNRQAHHLDEASYSDSGCHDHLLWCGEGWLAMKSMQTEIAQWAGSWPVTMGVFVNGKWNDNKAGEA